MLPPARILPTNITTTPLAVTLDIPGAVAGRRRAGHMDDGQRAEQRGGSICIGRWTRPACAICWPLCHRLRPAAGWVPIWWLDDSLPAAPELFYWLEAVGFNGTTSLFGPVRGDAAADGSALGRLRRDGRTGNGMVGWLAVAVTLLAGVGALAAGSDERRQNDKMVGLRPYPLGIGGSYES